MSVAGLVYSTELVLAEPWLVDRHALEELSTIIDDCWGNLVAKQDDLAKKHALDHLEKYYKNLSPDKQQEKLPALVAEEQQRASRSQRKEVVLGLKNDKAFEAHSVAQILKEPALHSELPKSLSVKLRTEEADVRLSLEHSFGPRLRLQVSPEQDELSKKIFVELREWAYKNRVPWWQRVLHKLPFFYWTLWFIVVMFSLSLQPSPTDNAVKAARAEAHQILNEGVSVEKIPKAIELLLRIESKYATVTSSVPYPLWFKLLLYVGFLIGIVISIRPQLVIGIGKGASRIEWWRRWLKIVSVALPALFFSTFLSPYLQNLWPKLLGQ